MDNYLNREQAGLLLAQQLKFLKGTPNLLVLALPRGGVPVAYPIAKSLAAPLDVFIVRKLGVPGQEELAFGALASPDTVVYNETVLKLDFLTQEQLDQVILKEKKELARRQKAYRGNKAALALSGKTIILVDDGIATGASIKAAITAIEMQHPHKLIVAVPVAAQSTCEEIQSRVDELVCPLQPVHFYAVGTWYQDFSQTSDEEVIDLLGNQNWMA